MHNTLFATVLLSASGFAQAPEAPATPSPSTQSPSAQMRVVPAGVQAWIKQLGSDSYRDRLEAENKLRAMGAGARQALEAAAKSEGDGEVQWRAKRLLRQIDKGDAAAKQRAPGKRGGSGKRGLVDRRRAGEQESEVQRSRLQSRERGDGDGMRSDFDRLLRLLEDDLGGRVGRHRLLDDAFFDDLRSRANTDSSSQSTSVRIGPDGVHVEVTETGEDGKLETKEYDAPDMEAFRQKYPGVLRQNDLGMGLQLFGKDNMGKLRAQVRGLLPSMDRRMLRPRVLPFDRSSVRDEGGVAAPVPAVGRRLGISIKPIPDALRDYLELADGSGLMVASVQPGTLAKSLGLKSGDIVLTINQQPIASPTDVSKALAAIKQGEEVKVAYVRRGQRDEAKAAKRHSASSARAPMPVRKQQRESIR